MNIFIKSLLFPLITILVVYSSCTACKREMGGPSHAISEADGPGLNPGVCLASIYRDYISSVDGQECQSIPSCSSYSIAAFKEHGIFIGWMMTVDRLIHEGRDETLVSPVVYSYGRWKILDPLENNDFWWFHGNRKHHE